MRERESLIARIRYLRRVAGAAEAQPLAATSDVDSSRLEGVERRLSHLEQLLEGLQDSVHRESLRQSKRIAELEARIEPGALGAALDKDARERGL